MQYLLRQHNQIYDVFIFTECGGTFGYGHITRCFSLIDELIRHSKKPLLIVHNEKKDFTTSKCSFVIDKWYNNFYHYFQGSNLSKPISIIDSYVADLNIYQNISELSSNSLYIDDTCRLSYPKGIIVNSSLCANELQYKRKPGQKYLLGKNYVILRKEFNDSNRNFCRTVKSQIEDILIIMGGSDIRNLSPNIVSALNKIGYHNVIKHVVIGKGYDNDGEIKAVSNRNIKLYYDLNAKSLCDLMCTCDYAITAAGQTVYELIATSLPFLCIKVIDNQDSNVSGLLKEKVIDEYLSYTEDNMSKNLEKDLTRILNIYTPMQRRARQIDNMRLLDFCNGTNRIIEELLRDI